MDLHSEIMKVVFDPDTGTMKAINVDQSAEFLVEARWPQQLLVDDIKHYASALLAGRYIDEPSRREDWPQLTYVRDFHLDKVPARPVIKLMRKEHAELFLSQGWLRLGSINHYRAFEHSEIGDKAEGGCILVGMNHHATIMRQVVGGLHEWLFCCYVGSPQPDVLQQFGYDAAIQINDVAGFSSAVSEALGAKAAHFCRCRYSKDRVIVGPSDENIYDSNQHADFAEMLGFARAFIKHDRFQHQREFRFLWSMASGVDGFLDIKSEKAAACCEIVNL